uniref:CSON000507 protein n=1 Tax=Culicoides sonorensis TaxID=179676 RepID=A0A336MS97_CULSO
MSLWCQITPCQMEERKNHVKNHDKSFIEQRTDQFVYFSVNKRPPTGKSSMDEYLYHAFPEKVSPGIGRCHVNEFFFPDHCLQELKKNL